MGKAKHQKFKTRYPGVRYYEHETDKHGIHKDRYFTIRFQVNGKRIEEGYGWASHGRTAEGAFAEIQALKKSHRKGDGPTRLAEQRALVDKKRKEKAQARRLAAKAATTFGRFFLDTYLPYAEAEKKPNSVRTEKGLFEKWIEPEIGDNALKVVSQLDIQRIKQAMVKEGKAAASIRYALAVIRQTFNYAKAIGFFHGDSPVSNVRFPKADNRRMRFLTHEEADDLLAALKSKSQKVHDIALLSLHCGLRANEIFSLTWGDVDLKRKQLFIRDPKNKRNRHAYLTADTKAILHARKRGRPNDLVFVSQKKGAIAQVSKTFNREVEKLGLNDGVTDRRLRACFHTLRHTYASWHVEAGTDLYVLKELLGHATIRMTERYAHVQQGTLRNAVAKLEAATKRAREMRKKEEEEKEKAS